jgi:biopolymer transport protein ExbB
LWPIIACSVVGLALFLDRAYEMYRYRKGHRELIEKIFALVSAGELDEARAACQASKGPVASVLGTFLRTLHLPTEEREQILAVSGNRELRRMEQGLRGLGVIARISPLLGLLGTVVGLVSAFLAVSTMQGPPDPSVLASGIWQALLTTVAGLMVAIPAILSHEWLTGQLDDLAFSMEEAVAELVAIVHPGAPRSSGSELQAHDRIPKNEPAAGTR